MRLHKPKKISYTKFLTEPLSKSIFSWLGQTIGIHARSGPHGAVGSNGLESPKTRPTTAAFGFSFPSKRVGTAACRRSRG